MSAIITALSVFFILRLNFDSSIEVWFLDNDPNIKTYHEFLNRFQADEIVVMGVFANDVFSPAVLASLDRMTQAAEKGPYVYRVKSLANIRVARGDEETLEMKPLISARPQTVAESRELRQTAQVNKILEGILTCDASATAIIVEMDPGGNSFQGKTELTQYLRKIALEEKQTVSVLLSGTPPIDEAFFLYSKRDMMLLVPCVALCIFLLLWFFFRRFSVALMPFCVVIMSCLWLLGSMALFGKKINILTSGVLAVILAVGVADAVHFISEYYRQRRQGVSHTRAMEESFRVLWKPCLLTTTTTMAGMLALLTSDLQPVREFGYLSCFGVALAFVVTMILIPCLLSLRPLKEISVNKPCFGYVERFLFYLARISVKRAQFILLVAFCCVLLSAVGMTRLHVGANVFNYFKQDDPIRVNTTIIENTIGGSAAIEFVVQTEEGGFADPALLNKLDQFQVWLRQQTGVSYVVSVVDQIKELNRVYHNNEAEYFVIPQERSVLAQFLLILSAEEEYESFVQDNDSVARISLRARFREADLLAKRIPVIEKQLVQIMGSDQSVFITGFVKLMRDMEEYLLSSQIKSVSLALILITLMMGFLFRSAKMALFALIPNVLPVLAGLGFMAFVGIDLDPGTVMIASIALGLVVDDTIHFLARYQLHLKNRATVQQAIAKTMFDAGHPIIYTSLILSCGFVVMTLGSFAPNIHFGLITGFVIIMALLADLFVLPAALLCFNRNFKAEG